MLRRLHGLRAELNQHVTRFDHLRIGPKLGVTVLSGLAAEDLTTAIRSGDIQKLTRIPGVGKKTAELIVLLLLVLFPSLVMVPLRWLI